MIVADPKACKDRFFGVSEPTLSRPVDWRRSAGTPPQLEAENRNLAPKKGPYFQLSLHPNSYNPSVLRGTDSRADRSLTHADRCAFAAQEPAGHRVRRQQADGGHPHVRAVHARGCVRVRAARETASSSHPWELYRPLW